VEVSKSPGVGGRRRRGRREEAECAKDLVLDNDRNKGKEGSSDSKEAL